jgi:hypothetical protein
LTINQLSLSENALKLAFGNVEFQIFWGNPDPPLQGEGKGRGREEWKREEEEWAEEGKGMGR